MAELTLLCTYIAVHPPPFDVEAIPPNHFIDNYEPIINNGQ
jgi:hypothetical protein